MRLPVLDRQLLARVCRQVERWEGSWREAARRLRVGAGTFWRLRAANGGDSLNTRVFDALYHYLPPDSVSDQALRRWERDLFNAVLNPQAMGSLTTYRRWLMREVRRFAKHWDRDLDWPRARRDGTDRYSACVRLLRELRHRYPAEFARVYNLMWHGEERVRVKTAEGEKTVSVPIPTSRGGRTTDRLRWHLAELRVVEPLLASDASGGIERGFRELEQADSLRAYLRAAINREFVLLEREADIERAQQMGAGSDSRRTSSRKRRG